jgi:hypothetical protein
MNVILLSLFNLLFRIFKNRLLLILLKDNAETRSKKLYRTLDSGGKEEGDLMGCDAEKIH